MGSAPNGRIASAVTLRITRAAVLALALGALMGLANAAPAMAFGNRISVEPSGDVIEAGGVTSFNVARYLPDGSLDPSFGSHGIATLNVPKNCWASATAPIVDSKGRILVVGSGRCPGHRLPFGPSSSVLARFRPDGRLDKSFADHGLAIEPRDRGDAVAIGPTGRIVVAGVASRAGYGIVLLRYHRDGSPDSTLGRGGRVDTGVGPNRSGVDVALTPRGRIVVGGTLGDCNHIGCSFSFGLARFLANGDRDTSFGTNGLVDAGVPGNPGVNAVALDSSGRIVVVGYGTASGASSTFTVERFMPAGSLDSGFGSGGAVTTAFDSCAGAYATSVVIDGAGDLVVAGSCLPPSGGNDLALARYISDGSLDSSFGSGGTLTTHFAFGTGANSSGVGLGAVDETTAGAFGTNATISRSAFLLARYTSAGALDPSFGSGGTVTTRLPWP